MSCKRHMEASSGRPPNESSCVGGAVAALTPSEVTGRHDCQYHTHLLLWRGHTLKSGTLGGFDICAGNAVT
jgi:hypothetical protein